MDKRSIFLSPPDNCKPIVGAMMALFLLAGCATGPQERPEEAETATLDEVPVDGGRLSEQLGPETDPDVLFHVLAAERLIDMRQYIDAAEQYLEAAQISEDPALAREVSRMAIRLGEWDMAVAGTGRWLELEPGNRNAQEIRALAWINAGDPERAVDTLAELIDSHDDQSEAWRRAALLIGAGEDEDQALDILSRLVERTGRDAMSPEVLHIQSVLQWQIGDAGAALESALAAAEISGERRYRVWAAQLASSEEDFEQALALYRQARQDNPDDLPLALSEAEALRRLERREEALEVLEQLPPDREVLYTRGLHMLEAEDKESAERIRQELIAMGPDEDLAMHAYMVAQLAELLDNDEEALKWYRRVDEGPNRERSIVRRAVLKARADELDQARALLEALRDDDPSMAEQTWMVEAELLREAGQADAAVAVMNKALRERPGSIRLLYSRALAAVAIDDIDLAEQDLRRIIQMDGNNAMALNALGYTLTDRTNRHQEAYRLIRRALELEPDDPAILDSMGWVYFRLGQPETALPYLERALDGEDNPEIAAHVIEVLWTLERFDEARAVLDHALEHYPDDDYLVDTLERLGLPD